MNRVILENISKTFKIGYVKKQGALARLVRFISGKEPKRKFKALNNVSLILKSSEILGIIGENGSGKSTLLRIIAGIYDFDSGNKQINGKIISLLNLKAGLKTHLSLKENIYLCCSLFGLSNKEVNKKIKPIISFSELERFTETKLYQLSEGMKQRLAFSIAIHCKPEILLLDEVFEVGDEDFKKKSARKIRQLARKGAGVILVTHELWMIEKYCDRVILVDKGEIKLEGSAKEVIKKYKK